MPDNADADNLVALHRPVVATCWLGDDRLAVAYGNPPPGSPTTATTSVAVPTKRKKDCNIPARPGDTDDGLVIVWKFSSGSKTPSIETRFRCDETVTSLCSLQGATQLVGGTSFGRLVVWRLSPDHESLSSTNPIAASRTGLDDSSLHADTIRCLTACSLVEDSVPVRTVNAIWSFDVAGRVCLWDTAVPPTATCSAAWLKSPKAYQSLCDPTLFKSLFVTAAGVRPVVRRCTAPNRSDADAYVGCADGYVVGLCAASSADQEFLRVAFVSTRTHNGPVTAVAISDIPHAFVATVGVDASIRLWTADLRSLIVLNTFPGPCTDLVLHPRRKDKALVVDATGTVTLVDLVVALHRGKSPTTAVKIDSSGLVRCAWSRTTSRLVVGSTNGALFDVTEELVSVKSPCVTSAPVLVTSTECGESAVTVCAVPANAALAEAIAELEKVCT